MKRRLRMFLTAILIALSGCSNRDFSSGDRVLVAKFLYDSHVTEPKRFDVVVFKYPKGPLERNVPKNYIKRLLGLPGEILAIFFGRLYRIPAPEPGQPPHFNDIADKKIDPNDLWQGHTHEDDSRPLFDAGKFEIVRKPPEVMMAMRRPVYDNDFPAKDLKGPDWQRWRPAEGSSWVDNKDNSFSYKSAAKVGAAGKGAAKDSVDWLRYRHIVRPMGSVEGDPPPPPIGGRPPELITDFLAYNSFITYTNRRGYNYREIPSPNWIGDLMLECKVTVAKAEGEFALELSKGINRFQARWDLSSGMCTLFKEGKNGQKAELDSKPTRLKSPGSYLVRFANIDARLTVWVDRDLPFENGRDYPPPEVRGPDEKNLEEAVLQARRGPTKNDLEPASIGSKGAAVDVHNITLWRDTYYQSSVDNADVSLSPGDWSDPDKWGAFKRLSARTLYVQPGHYLCLGDNSQQSSDSRAWGLVPHRLMLGRALLVYFPFNRAGAIR